MELTYVSPLRGESISIPPSFATLVRIASNVLNVEEILPSDSMFRSLRIYLPYKSYMQKTLIIDSVAAWHSSRLTFYWHRIMESPLS